MQKQILRQRISTFYDIFRAIIIRLLFVSKDFFKNFIILTYTTLMSLYYKTLCYRCILFILERLNFRLKFYNFYLHPVYKLLSYYTYCKNIFRSKNEGTSWLKRIHNNTFNVIIYSKLYVLSNIYVILYIYIYIYLRIKLTNNCY